MKTPKFGKELEKSQRLFWERFLLFAAHFVTFRIRSVLSALSFTESAVEVGER